MSEASIAMSVPRAERKPEVGLRERRSVVDAVADHRDDPARALEILDRLHLPGRIDAREHALDPDLGRDTLGRPGAVTGEQHRLEAERPELAGPPRRSSA